MRRAALLLMVAALAPLVAQTKPEKTTYVYKTAGELKIQLDVYRGAGKNLRPGIFYIHGGALIGGSRGSIHTKQLARYIEAGFNLVSIDYRLAPETKLPEILTDVEDAWRWVQKNGKKLAGIDPKRVAVVGHSAGGYLTLTTGYRVKPLPRALVSFYGYGDLIAEWYAKPDPFYSSKQLVPEQEARDAVGVRPVADVSGQNQRFRYYLFLRQRGLWPNEVSGVDPAVHPEAYKPWCPASNVTKKFPPTMLLHGDKDTDVPVTQSDQMAELLKQHGVECEYIRVAGAGHGFDGKMNDAATSALFERAVEFLQKRLNAHP
jgi:acetyl esterase/lipase